MQKTTKNLLTKIFVLLTVIFCVFALALGAIGCANEETKAVTKVSVNGNVITIEWSDNTKDDLTIDVGEDYVECGHNEYVLLSSDVIPSYAADEEIRSDICRASIYGCAVCDDVYAVYEEHELGSWKVVEGQLTFVAGETNTEAATCTKKGYEGMVCKHCDYIEGEILEMVDHDFATFEIVLEDGVNKCTDVWFSGEKVCKDCGLTYLVVEEPTGHTYKNIRVGTYATNDVAAVLIADCDACKTVGVEVKKLYTLASEEAKTEYAKSIVANYKGYHTATYTYVYEGVTYAVAEDFQENHKTVIDDYTAEAYPEINFKSGETLTCHSYADAIYICPECDTAVDVKVKKGHTVSEDAKYVSTTADCEKAGVETYICEVEACKAEVKVDVAAYGHNFAKLLDNSLVENADGSINVTFVCTNEYNGVACGKTNVLKNIKDYEKKDANCEEDGYIKYTTEDGQKAELVLKADGKHVLEGYEGTVESDAVLAYEDVEAISAIKYKSGSPATCGTQANAVFVCSVCDSAIDVKVAREHVETNVEVTSEPDCVTAGSYSYNCKYENCEYHTTKATNGVIPTVGHEFSYVANSVNATDKTIKVVCAVENCKYHTESTFAYKALVEERDMTCADYAAGKTNSNTYTITVDGKDYNVVEAIANKIHVLNGENVEEGDTFTVGTPGIYKYSGELANCTVTADSIFICEACDCAVEVILKGECQVPADLAAATKEDAISCEVAAYKYWICADCNERHNLEKISDATGHAFTYELKNNNTVATVSCTNKGCTLAAFDVVLADIDDENVTVEKTCEKTTTTYVYNYKSANGFAQDVEIVVEEATGSHSYLKDATGADLICKYVEKDANGNIVREGYGYYCTACNQYFIKGWIIPGARPWQN